MRLFEAERTRHAVAAGVDFVHFKASSRQHRHGRRRADQRLLVTVAVEQPFSPLAVRGERNPAGFPLPSNLRENSPAGGAQSISLLCVPFCCNDICM